ncbi:hypothetical protein HGRIS_010859 [Hohenbuehelia grisea]|uniref:TEA domain-containing protein n=1 Tax=Hohenbuehelia grisea TaxID=104357 RepID=A0ABR3IYB8_9AGAR
MVVIKDNSFSCASAITLPPPPPKMSSLDPSDFKKLIGRQANKRDKSGRPVWPQETEELLIEALEDFQKLPVRLVEGRLPRRFPRRNQILAAYIEKRIGEIPGCTLKVPHARQVASRVQTLAHACKDPRIRKFLSPSSNVEEPKRSRCFLKARSHPLDPATHAVEAAGFAVPWVPFRPSADGGHLSMAFNSNAHGQDHASNNPHILPVDSAYRSAAAAATCE